MTPPHYRAGGHALANPWAHATEEGQLKNAKKTGYDPTREEHNRDRGAERRPAGNTQEGNHESNPRRVP
eukprot:13448113-Alexandrium_andersonii.AAC.1